MKHVHFFLHKQHQLIMAFVEEKIEDSTLQTNLQSKIINIRYVIMFNDV